jgi:hypothetical protein
VDESSLSTYQFTDQKVLVKPSLDTATVVLRYNVLPVGELLVPVTQACCERRALMVRFLDNGSGAQVLVKVKQYNVRTGQLTTLMSFDSNNYSPELRASTPAWRTPPWLRAGLFQVINQKQIGQVADVSVHVVLLVGGKAWARHTGHTR